MGRGPRDGAPTGKDASHTPTKGDVMDPMLKEVEEAIGALMDAKAQYDVADAARMEAEIVYRNARMRIRDILHAAGEKAVEVYTRDGARMVAYIDKLDGFQVLPLAIPEELATGEPL